MAEAPWYSYAYDSNFGQPDPVGPYPKPDSNFYGIPNGTPITALVSGVVTGVRRQPWGPLAYSITVRMDNPFNNIARYTAYNYVSSPQVGVGEHINAGDTLAFSGNPYNIGTAFALIDTPVYGTGSSNEPFSGSYVNPALNPVPFLQSVLPQGGQGGTLQNTLNSNFLDSGSGNGNGNTSAPDSFMGFDFTRFIDAALLFIVALVLVVVGGMLLLNKSFSLPEMSVKA